MPSNDVHTYEEIYIDDYKPAVSLWNKWKWRLLILPALYELLQAFEHRFIGLGRKKLINAIIPAQTFPQFRLNDAEIWQQYDAVFAEEKELVYKRIGVTTVDGCRLETLEIIPRSLLGDEYKESDTIPINPAHKYIIKFVGNKSSFIRGIDNSDTSIPEKERPLQPVGTPTGAMKEMIVVAKESQCRVILFNYRGVGRAETPATKTADLVTDGRAQVHRLIANDVPGENVLLSSHSLGAAAAACVAGELQSKGVHVHLFHSRSFASITKFILGIIRRIGVKPNADGKKPGNASSRLGRVLAFILDKLGIVKGFVSFTQCELNAAKNYNKLNPHCKQYIVARSKAEDIKGHPGILDDTVMPNSVSLDQGLPQKRRDPFAVVAVKKELREKVDAHDASMDELICYQHNDTYTAKHAFTRFVEENFKKSVSRSIVLDHTQSMHLADNVLALKFPDVNVLTGIKIHTGVSALLHRTISIDVLVAGACEKITVVCDRAELLSAMRMRDPLFQYRNLSQLHNALLAMLRCTPLTIQPIVIPPLQTSSIAPTQTTPLLSSSKALSYTPNYYSGDNSLTQFGRNSKGVATNDSASSMSYSEQFKRNLRSLLD